MSVCIYVYIYIYICLNTCVFNAFEQLYLNLIEYPKTASPSSPARHNNGNDTHCNSNSNGK